MNPKYPTSEEFQEESTNEAIRVHTGLIDFDRLLCGGMVHGTHNVVGISPSCDNEFSDVLLKRILDTDQQVNVVSSRRYTDLKEGVLEKYPKLRFFTPNSFENAIQLIGRLKSMDGLTVVDDLNMFNMLAGTDGSSVPHHTKVWLARLEKMRSGRSTMLYLVRDDVDSPFHLLSRMASTVMRVFPTTMSYTSVYAQVEKNRFNACDPNTLHRIRLDGSEESEQLSEDGLHRIRLDGTGMSEEGKRKFAEFKRRSRSRSFNVGLAGAVGHSFDGPSSLEEVAFKGPLGLGYTDLSEVRKHVLGISPEEGQVNVSTKPVVRSATELADQLVNDLKGVQDWHDEVVSAIEQVQLSSATGFQLSFSGVGTSPEGSVREVTYCSFALPEVSLGVVIVRGNLNPVEASLYLHRKGLNPGGQLVALPCKESDEDIPKEIFQAMWDNADRLIPPEEAVVLFDAKRLGDFENGGGLDEQQ